MPNQGRDDGLDKFMSENNFNRSQVQTKFAELKKIYRNTDDVDNDITNKESDIYRFLVNRAKDATTTDILSIVKRAPAFTGPLATFDFDESFVAKLLDVSMWHGFCTKILELLASILSKTKSIKQHKITAKQDGDKELQLKSMSLKKYGGAND